MPSLDVRGDIGAAQLAFYVPISALCLFLIFRYAFRRDAGWFFLFWFALARIAGGALIIAAEMVIPSNINLYIVAYLLFPVGLGFLLLSTVGFLGQAGQHSYSDYKGMSYLFRFIGLLALIGIAFSVSGGLLGTHINPNAHVGLILRRVAACVYAATYVILIITHFMCVYHRHFMRSYRRKLLLGLFLALPFIGVRVAYGILAVWSSSDIFGTQLSSNPVLPQFNPNTGNFITYLVMGLAMEFCTAAIYLFFSTVRMRERRY